MKNEIYLSGRSGLLDFTLLFPLYSSSRNETKELSNSLSRFPCPENMLLWKLIMLAAKRIRRRTRRVAFAVPRWEVRNFLCGEYALNEEHQIFNCFGEIVKKLFCDGNGDVEEIDNMMRTVPMFDMTFTGVDDLLRKETLENLVKKFLAEMNKLFHVEPEGGDQLTKASVEQFRKQTRDMLTRLIDIIYPAQNFITNDLHPAKLIMQKITTILHKIGCMHQPPISTMLGNQLDEDMKSYVVHTFLEIWWLLLCLTYAISTKYPEEDRVHSLRLNSIVSGMKSFHGEVKFLYLFGLTMFAENYDRFETIVLAPCACVEQMWLLLDIISNWSSLTFFEWLESNRSPVKFFSRILDRDSRNMIIYMQRQTTGLRLTFPQLQLSLQYTNAYPTLCWSFVYGILTLLAKHSRPLDGSRSTIWALLNSTALKNVYTELGERDMDEVDMYLRRYLILLCNQFSCYDSVGIFFWDIFKKLLPIIKVNLESYTGVASCFEAGLKWSHKIQELIDQPMIALERKFVGMVDRFIAVFILHLKAPNGDPYRAKFKSRMLSLMQSRSPVIKEEVSVIFLLSNLFFHYCAMSCDCDLVDKWLLEGLNSSDACLIDPERLKHFWIAAMLHMKLRRGNTDHCGCEALCEMVYASIHCVINRYLCTASPEQRADLWRRIVVYFEALSLFLDNPIYDCEKEDLLFVKINFEQLVQEAKKHKNLVESDVRSILVLLQRAYSSIKVWPTFSRSRMLPYEITSSKALLVTCRDYNNCPGLGAAWYAYMVFSSSYTSVQDTEIVLTSLISRFVTMMPCVTEMIDLMNPLLNNDRLVCTALPVRLMMSQRIMLILFFQCWLFGQKFQVPTRVETHVLALFNSRMDLGIVAEDLVDPGRVSKRAIDRVQRFIEELPYDKRMEVRSWLLQWAVPSSHAAMRRLAIMLCQLDCLNESLLKTLITGLCYLLERTASLLLSRDLRGNGTVNYLYVYFLDFDAHYGGPLRMQYPDLLEKLESALLLGLVRGSLEVDIGLINAVTELVMKIFFRPDIINKKRMRAENVYIIMNMVMYVKKHMSERKYQIVRNLLFTELMKRTVQGRQITSSDVVEESGPEDTESQLIMVKQTAKLFFDIMNFDSEISFLFKTDYFKWCCSCYIAFYPKLIDELNYTIGHSLNLLINAENDEMESLINVLTGVLFSFSNTNQSRVKPFFKFILEKLPHDFAVEAANVITRMVFKNGQSTEQLHVFHTIVVHPLDLLKIRHAVNEKYSGLRPALNNYLHSACSIFRERSFIGFYQGITPNLIGSTLAWGLYFAQYNWFKDFLRQWFQLENLSAWHALIAGIYAGNVTLLLTNPVWVAKTRLCLQYENQPKQYRGMIDVLVKLYRMDGIRGLYKGYLPGIVGTSHGAIQFMAYDELKKHFGSHEPKASEHLTFAVLSKSFAVLSTYPYQVIRARLQDQHLKYNGIMDAVSRTWRHERLYGFYKGLLPSLLRVTPATCITFLIYEEVSKYLTALQTDRNLTEKF
ncbi:Mitochondrial folate transporter/carrier [Trichinella murrelli]|uniref:Mitochondrial folate transporter/carrier n=1 Tax=Trichinella murrelli TaxID=144512 RepID=A0A0V0TU18_9BILA|nr:Mitochondrial folate transporter/carrier [Trichinella murrelli]